MDPKLMHRQFIKMQGTGNNFIILQHNNQSIQQLSSLAIRLCNPNYSIGADGILLICRSQQPNTNFHMKILNRDGSSAQMCGNGLRCFCACLRQLGLQKSDKFDVSTDAGIKKIEIYRKLNIYRIKIQMGKFNVFNDIQDMNHHLKSIISDFQHLSAHFVVFNIPHYVIYLQQMPCEQKIIQIGKILQKNINSNINFAKLEQKQNGEKQLYLRTFERGAGLTLACGTGACASFLVGIKNCLFKKEMNVRTQGGLLIIRQEQEEVVMDGPAQFICRGTYY